MESSSGLTDKSSISTLSGSPKAEWTFKLPNPAEYATKGIKAKKTANDICLILDLRTLTLDPTVILNYKNNIKYLSVQAEASLKLRPNMHIPTLLQLPI